jgi:hypothetical protein
MGICTCQEELWNMELFLINFIFTCFSLFLSLKIRYFILAIGREHNELLGF